MQTTRKAGQPCRPHDKQVSHAGHTISRSTMQADKHPPFLPLRLNDRVKAGR